MNLKGWCGCGAKIRCAGNVDVPCPWILDTSETPPGRSDKRRHRWALGADTAVLMGSSYSNVVWGGFGRVAAAEVDVIVVDCCVLCRASCVNPCVFKYTVT